MGIVNRRNALIGWAVVKVGKRQLKSKAKLPGRKEGRKLPGVSVITSSVAALGGALWYVLRRKRGEDKQGE